MGEKLIPTTLVGSYPHPTWLVDKDMLLGNSPPRVRMRDVWKVPARELEEAQDDAVGRLAEQGEVRAVAVERRAERIRGTWPGLHADTPLL